MRFERCQHGGEPDESNRCFGEAGEGIYAYVPSPAMRRYYSANGEAVYSLSLLDGQVVDLTHPAQMAALLAFARAEFKRLAATLPGYQVPPVSAKTIQRFGRVVTAYIDQHHPDAVAYIVPHQGPGIPSGKQVVIRRLDAFSVEPLERSRPRPR